MIEFDSNLKDGLNLMKFRNVEDDSWYYLYIDIETLNLLVTNFGIISTLRMPTQVIYADTPLTCKTIRMNFCGAPIELSCCNNDYIYLPIMEQNY